MKLPNAREAVIPEEKLASYCLDPNHHHGQHKAFLFQRLLGLTADRAEDLRQILLDAVRNNEVVSSKQTEHGVLYYIDSNVTYNDRTFVLRSLWIILNGEIIPRFVSCYIRRRRSNESKN